MEYVGLMSRINHAPLKRPCPHGGMISPWRAPLSQTMAFGPFSTNCDVGHHSCLVDAY